MSDFASTSLADCFCLPRFHAILDNAFDQGSLARCAGCNYQGLECRGGFENETNGTERRHAQPVAEPPACVVVFETPLLEYFDRLV